MTTNERISRLRMMLDGQIEQLRRTTSCLNHMRHELEVLKAGEPVTECVPCKVAPLSLDEMEKLYPGTMEALRRKQKHSALAVQNSPLGSQIGFETPNE